MNSNYQPVNELRDGGNYGDVLDLVRKKGFSEIRSIFESDETLLIIDFSSTVIVDKKTNKGVACSDYLKPSKDMFSFNANNLVCDYQRSFVGLVSRTEVSNASEYYEDNKIIPSSTIDEIIKRNDPELNPILAFYYFK